MDRNTPRGGRRGLRLWLSIALIILVTAVAGVVLWTSMNTSRDRGVVAPAAAVTDLPGHPPSPVRSFSSSEERERVDSCIAALLATLSLEQRVGQLLMVGAPVDDPQRSAEAVGQYSLGGVFLAGRSTQAAAVHRQAIQRLQQRAIATVGIPLQVAVDQEGGEVQTLQGADFPAVPTAVEQGKWDPATLRGRTADWADRLAAVGVTMDLAPVADTVPAGTAEHNPPIGALDRQYGSDPGHVANSVAVVVSTMQNAGVLAALKHFPGLGRVRANTDTSTDAVDDVTTAEDPYLSPFAGGIGVGSGSVMISSARYPRLDPDTIAAFSEPIVTGLLRQRMGYSGLVISDDLGAAIAVQDTPVGERAVRFVRAGGDLALTVRPADAKPMTDALVQAARDSPTFTTRVADAATHVLLSKYRAGLLSCPTA